MTTIKDGVHDHIEIQGITAELLDTPLIQRLRRVTQLGTVHLVYPAASHTRFEHSIGVYYLMNRALSHLGLDGPQAERLRAAAVLHDVGHSPYSHNLEPVIHRHTDKYHDDVINLLIDSVVGDTLSEHGHDPERIAALIRGDGKYGQLISGELDVDRMDYLVRDAHHTGVPYGTIDHERLIRALTFVDGELALAAGNVQTAESLLLARALMNPTVYRHHVARISKTMLRRAAERLIIVDSVAITASQLRRMDDHDLYAALRSTEQTSQIASRLDTRNLYKRAVWAERDAVPESIIDADYDTIRSFERTVADRIGLDPEEVIIDVPERPSMTESSSRVVVSGEVRRLADQSPLVSALRTAQKQQWRLGVYVPAVETDRAGTTAVETMGLDISGALVSDIQQETVTATLDEFND
ncbi:HD domain-containing protein [Haloquadratum walsbyi]|jgi:HD superfamily phosphohydrolases|nr:HD domain-containing protein [Haloquadratum walsbyi]